MDISPKHEAELANVLHAELPKEFQHMIHTVNHPVTRRDVTSILEANELSTLSSGQDTSLGLAHLIQSPAYYESHMIETRARQEADGEVPGRAWSLLVVDVNVAASFINFIVSR